MANIFILGPDGSKTLVTKDQLVTFAQSGKINADSHVEVLGRVVLASKIKELKPFFETHDSLTSETSSATEPAQKEAPSAPEETTPADSTSTSTDADIYDVATPPPSAPDSSVPPIGASAMIPPSSMKTSSMNTNIPAALDDTVEVSPIVDTKRVKRFCKKRLGFLFYLYWTIGVIGILVCGVFCMIHWEQYFTLSRVAKSQIQPVYTESLTCWVDVISYKDPAEGKRWSDVKKSLNKLFEVAEKHKQQEYQIIKVKNALKEYESIDYSTKYFESARAAALDDLSDAIRDLADELRDDLKSTNSLASEHKTYVTLGFITALAWWLLVYTFHRIVFLLLGNVIRREIYQVEQISVQKKIMKALKSKS